MHLKNATSTVTLDVLGYAYEITGWLRLRVRVLSSSNTSYDAVDPAIESDAFAHALRVMDAMLTSTSPRHRLPLRFTEPCISARIRKRKGAFVVKLRLSHELAPPPRRLAWEEDFPLTRAELVEFLQELEACSAKWNDSRRQSTQHRGESRGGLHARSDTL